MLLLCCFYVAVMLLLFCCYFAVLSIVCCYIYTIGVKDTVIKEDLVKFYLVILLWNMVDPPRNMKVIVALMNIQALFASRSTGDNDDSEGSGGEEVIKLDGDYGNCVNDTWRFM